jgi:GNAT superfamily N-acetyltransferase
VNAVTDAVTARIVDNFTAWLPLLRHLDGADFQERHGVVSWTSVVPYPMFCGLWGPPEAEDVESAVDELLARFEGKSFLWAIPPGHDLDRVFETRQLEVSHPPGMALALDALPPLRVPTGVSVKRVDGDRANLVTAATVSMTANGFPADAAEPFVALLDRIEDPSRLATFLATVDGGPAAASVFFRTGSVAGLYNVGTLPEFRRRGLGRLVSLAALHAARDEGCEHGVLQSSPEGEPVYRALGFREHCRFTFVLGLPGASDVS